jgi:integrase
MATVFKRSKSPNWQISWFEPTARGKKRRTKSSGTTCKRTAQRIANEHEAQAALKRSGIIDVVADEIAKQSNRSIESHLGDFIAKLEAAGRSTKHIDDTQRKIRAVADFARFETAGDITPDGVNRLANSLKADGLSARTIGSYIDAIRAFTRWLTENQKSTRDPLVGVKKPNPAKDRRLERRFLEPDEWRHIQQAAMAGPERRGMTGSARALLYELAIVTGLRSNELRSLTLSSLDLGTNPIVICDACDTKNKKLARQHIPRHLAERLREYIEPRPPKANAFDMPHETSLARMLREDVADARLKWLSTFDDDPDKYASQERSDFLAARSAKGEWLDFHTLRHTCGAWLMMAGADIKTIQSVMRHSTIMLTLDTYGHLMPNAESDAVSSVDAILNPVAVRLSATGTDNQCQQLEHEPPRINATGCDESDSKWSGPRTQKAASPGGE